MWAKVAEEMAVPWRAAEAMHWQLGEADMARRAGVVPFSLSSSTQDNQPSAGRHDSPARGHSHSQSHSSTISTGSSGPNSRYGRSTPVSTRPVSGSSGSGSARSIAARRESTPRSVPPASPSDGLALAAIQSGMAMGIVGMSRGSQLLPSVAEMTTGISPYNTPAYAMSVPMGGAYGTSSPGPLLPALGFVSTRQDIKRRGSPDVVSRETSRRRQ